MDNVVFLPEHTYTHTRRFGFGFLDVVFIDTQNTFQVHQCSLIICTLKLNRINLGEWDAKTYLGFWDTDSLSRPDGETKWYLTKKRTYRIKEFAVPADHSVKLTESEKRSKYLRVCLRIKNMEHEDYGFTNYKWCTWNNSQISWK